MQSDYQRIAEAIRYLEENFRRQPSLEEVAAHLNLSPYHFQRLFKRWAGISPKRFLQFLTVEYAKESLAESSSVLDASYASGLSGPGRLHDLFINVEAVTPGEFKKRGEGLTIFYGRHATPFGDCLLAATERGICALQFVDDDSGSMAVSDLRARWREANVSADPAFTQPLADRIFVMAHGAASHSVTVLLKGTNFQLQVWRALLSIPEGAATTYGQIGAQIGRPNAARAVGNAVGANEIAYLIPCHRVIRASGIVDGYRWGDTRKKAMLGWEAAQRASLAEAVRS